MGHFGTATMRAHAHGTRDEYSRAEDSYVSGTLAKPLP